MLTTHLHYTRAASRELLCAIPETSQAEQVMGRRGEDLDAANGMEQRHGYSSWCHGSTPAGLLKGFIMPGIFLDNMYKSSVN